MTVTREHTIALLLPVSSCCPFFRFVSSRRAAHPSSCVVMYASFSVARFGASMCLAFFLRWMTFVTLLKMMYLPAHRKKSATTKSDFVSLAVVPPTPVQLWLYVCAHVYQKQLLGRPHNETRSVVVLVQNVFVSRFLVLFCGTARARDLGVSETHESIWKQCQCSAVDAHAQYQAIRNLWHTYQCSVAWKTRAPSCASGNEG